MANKGFRKGMIMPTLITQLKSILEQYPDDGQILKEIIQNAEDAKASKVIFLMDNTSYGTDSKKLHHPDMANYQGPALYAYNDAVFSERDWEGIRRMHDSIKADDPLKVGKFGLGFKSVFHITDIPSIFSASTIGFLDPHKRYFQVPVEGQSQPEKTSSYDWSLKEDRQDIQRLSHMFQPFIQETFGATKDVFLSGYFMGTMFRFPLRNRKMHSDLTNNVYDRQKVKQLLASLEKEGGIILLFLKHVRQIKFYEKENGKIHELLDIKVTDTFLKTVNQNCSNLSKHICLNTTEWYMNESCTVSYPLDIEVKKENGENEYSMWIVTQHFGGKTSSPTTQESIDGNLPLVGVASKSPCYKENISRESEPYGQVFCFLPLPLEEKSPTGFNFHVHGSFAVDQNRRHLKWTSADQDRSNVQDKDLIWNNFVTEKVLPVCIENHYKYLTDWHTSIAILNGGELQSQALEIYSIMPDENIVNHHWRNFVESLKKRIVGGPKLFSVTTSKWTSSISYILSTNDSELNELCIKIMSNDCYELACVPLHMLQFLSPRTGTPMSAADLCESYRRTQNRLNISEREKITLLNHFLKNLKDIKTLIGINLLPLSDGTWTSFQSQSSSNKINVCNRDYPERLFPNLKHKIVCSKRNSCFQDLSIIRNFNLYHVDSNSFVFLLRSMMTNFQENEIVLEKYSWFTRDWLKVVWAQINRCYPSNLLPFYGLHLIVLENNIVTKLSNIPTLIGTSLSDNRIDETLKGICSKLNIPLKETHKDEMYSHHCLWGTCIQPLRLRSVLSFMLQIHNPSRIILFERLTPDEIYYFVNALALETSTVSLNSQENSILRTLKLFMTINNSGRMTTSFVSVENLNTGTRREEYQEIPVPSCVRLLDLSNELIKQLACKLSVSFPNRQCLLEQAYIPGIQENFYSREELQLLMQHVCRHFKTLSFSSRKILLNIQFVTKSDGTTLVKAQDVFDNKDPALTILLKEDNFPSGIWRNDEFYEALVALGMKNSNLITVDDCIDIVRDMMRGNSSSIHQRYITLIQFLNRRPHLLDKKFKDQTKEFNWIEIKKSKPNGYPQCLDYFGEKDARTFAKVNELISSRYENIVGSACLIVDSPNFYAVEIGFGWNNGPSLGIVVQHFENLVRNYTPTDKIPTLALINEIYKYLENFSANDLKAIFTFDFRWIWIGNGFAEPSKVVMNHSKISLEPYVYVLPSEIKKFQRLWQCFAITDEANFIEILTSIKCYHENSFVIDKNRTSQDTNLVINILSQLAEVEKTFNDETEIFVPTQRSDNSKLRMELRQNCVYCDKHWYKLGFDIEDLDENIHLIHEKIPMYTAEKLKIASCLNRILDVEELQCSFGQIERITTRLRGLLKDYTDGLTVLKELIQNADDAGATEVTFVYDERRNGNFRTILLDEKMKDLQGPAIWCHNNAQFSREDFENIIKLGGATKESVNTKIGKFGLGFNSVYNLTDVPIFISNDYIVFLDPQTKYLDKAIINKNSPGIRLNLTTNDKKIRRLKDQFAPFNGMFGCDFRPESKMKNYDGTLFRFPLRTRHQADESEICKRHYSRDEVVQLFNCLNAAGEDLLLFSQNVNKITLCHIQKESTVSGMTEVFNVFRKIEEIIQNPSSVNNFSYLKTVSLALHTRNRCEFVFKMSVKMSFNDKASHNLNIKSAENRFNVWIVSWSSGIGCSFDMFTKDPSSLPIGAVAAKLELNESNALDVICLSKRRHGKLYCFLPFLNDTLLPVHVNGYFALNSSRTHMYVRSVGDKEDRRWDWNESLLRDAIPAAYCNLIQSLASSSVINLYQILPDESSCQNIPCFNILTESVYEIIFTKEMRIFRSIIDEKMYKLQDCLIFGQHLQNQRFEKAIETVLKIVGRLNGLHIVKVPDNVISCISKRRQALINDLTIDVTQFYKDFFVNNLPNLPKKVREEIIIQTMINNELCHHLQSDPCIPVTPSGKIFKCIDKLIHPVSSIAVLFDEKDQSFPYIPNNLPEREKLLYVKNLTRFGMRSDELSDDEVVERCHSVEKNPETLSKRLPILLKLIELCLNNANSCKTEFKEKITMIKMFPRMKKPFNFPYLWNDSNLGLISCEESYLDRKMLTAASTCPIIDECQSFKGGFTLLKKAFYLENKLLSSHSFEVAVKEIEKHFNKQSNYSLKNEEFANVISKTLAQLYDEIDLFVQYGIFENLESVRFCEMRLILTNSEPHRLMLPSQCSRTLHRSLLPYLCGVNETTVKSLNSTWSSIGIRESFEVADFVGILANIEKQYCKIQLDNLTMNLVINILECIYNSVTINSECPPHEFYLPNEQQILQLSTQLRYNDCEWHKLYIGEYTHDKISKSMASTFGIKTVSEDCFGQNELHFPFGQKEELVKRINRILEGYPLDEDIFKEMLQNADDARASEIHFIHDFRSLPIEKIFSERWKCLQGPSLCVYNNKSFTSKDLESIQKLGEGSKQGDITKTGQYGVGFNCVYRLTDAPSLLTKLKFDEPGGESNAKISGTVLGVFDPNCKYLHQATSSNPGGLYKAELVTKTFTDVYAGYLQDIKKYAVGNEGTIFRLPLRNKESKSLSKLKGPIISSQKLAIIIKEFQKGIHHCLLFLKCIESLSLVNIKYEAHRENTIVEVIENVRLEFDQESKVQKDEFMTLCHEKCTLLQNRLIKLEEIKSHKVIYRVNVCSSDSEASKWVLIQIFGFEDPSSLDPAMLTAYNQGQLDCQPCGGVAFPVNFFDSMRTHFRGRLFSFLPLPISTHLQVHVNGHFFLNHESRRDLWNEESETFKSLWNEAVISQIIAPAYCLLLAEIKNEKLIKSRSSHFRGTLNQFYELFPNQGSSSHPKIKYLVSEIYKYIYNSKIDVFLLYKPSSVINEMSEWTYIHEEVYFDDLDLQHFNKHLSIQKINEKEERLRNTLYSCGMKIIDCPSTTFIQFLEVGVENVKRITSASVMNHFSSTPLFNHIPAKIENTPFKTIEGLVEVLNYLSASDKDCMKMINHPFLLTADNVLRKFSFDDRPFESQHSKVAPHKLERFIHPLIEQFFSGYWKNESLIREMDINSLVMLLKDFHPDVLTPTGHHHQLTLDTLCRIFPKKEKCVEWLRAIWRLFGQLGVKYSNSKNKIGCWDEQNVGLIRNHYIVPVVVNKKEYFYPIFKRFAVIGPLNHTDRSSIKLYNALVKAGVPILDTKYFSTTTGIENLFGEVNNPANVLAALEEVYINRSSNSALDRVLGVKILRYFSRNVSVIQKIVNARAVLKCLPFYSSKDGQQVALQSGTIYLFPEDVPIFDINALPRTNTYLKDDRRLKELFKFLGCKELSVYDVYTEFIFDAFSKFNMKMGLEHLEYIRTLSFNAYDQQSKCFVKSLQTFRFINYSNQWRTASFFYDPDLRLFQLMENTFVPHPFNSCHWKRFLILCGFVNKLSTHKFLEYARKVAAMGQTAEEVQSLLIDNLLSSKDLVGNEEFLSIVKSIPFIIPLKIDEQLLIIHPAHTTSRFITLENSYLRCNTNLCWTMCDILPRKFHGLNDASGKKLGIKTELDLNTIVCNLENISLGYECSFNAHKTTILKSEEMVYSLTDLHLSWLEKCSNNIHNAAIKKLQNTKFIYVAKLHQLVKPNQVVIDIREMDEILPYIVKLPGFYGRYEKFLHALGATKSISVMQCALALESIKTSVGEIKMDPDKLNVANRLFDSIMKSAERDLQELSQVSKLYIPCNDGSLYESNNVYCTSNKLLEEFATHLDRPLVIKESIGILLNFPEQFRPIHIDDHLQEELFSVGNDAPFNANAMDFQEKIRHQNFIDGMIRINFYLLSNDDQSNTALDSISENIIDKLRRVTFSSKDSVVVHYKLYGNAVKCSEKSVPYFFHHDIKHDELIIYTTCKCNPFIFATQLAKYLSTFCNMLSGISFIETILMLDSDSIEEKLDLKMKPLILDFKPTLGNEIPIEDHFTLVQDVFVFYPTQLVAYEVDDPIERDEDGEAKYILVEIVEALKKTDSKFAMTYKINFGSYTEVVDAVRLYAFQTTNSSNKKTLMLPATHFNKCNENINAPSGLYDILDKIKQDLKEIWKLDETQRKKGINRLLLRYHPDKNHDDPEFYGEVFKHLKILIDILASGNCIDEYSANKRKKSKTQNTSCHFASESFGDGYFDRMNGRANRHSYASSKNCGGYSQHSYGSSNISYNRQYKQFFNRFSHKRRRDPLASTMCMRQARHDQNAATNDFQGDRLGPSSHQWACIKCYQAVRNAIKAVVFSKDGDKSFVIDKTLKDCCSEIYDQHLDSLVSEMDDLLTNKILIVSSSMGPAFENFTEKMVNEAYELAEKILCRCDKLIKEYNEYFK